jgi:hypothetical protein
MSDSITQGERREIAILAAQLVAEQALDFGSAKRKACERLYGASLKNLPRNAMPDSEDVDLALLEHLELFDHEAHQSRVHEIRTLALLWLERLAAFNPLVTGAAWKGVVAEHAHLHIEVFTDDTKEVEFALLNQGVEYESVDVAHLNGRDMTEALAITQHGKVQRGAPAPIPIQISLYHVDDLRGALNKGIHKTLGCALRGNAIQLAALVEQSLKTQSLKTTASD